MLEVKNMDLRSFLREHGADDCTRPAQGHEDIPEEWDDIFREEQ